MKGGCALLHLPPLPVKRLAGTDAGNITKLKWCNTNDDSLIMPLIFQHVAKESRHACFMTCRLAIFLNFIMVTLLCDVDEEPEWGYADRSELAFQCSLFSRSRLMLAVLEEEQTFPPTMKCVHSDMHLNPDILCVPAHVSCCVAKYYLKTGIAMLLLLIFKSKLMISGWTLYSKHILILCMPTEYIQVHPIELNGVYYKVEVYNIATLDCARIHPFISNSIYIQCLSNI